VLYLRGHWQTSEAALVRSIKLARSFGGVFPEVLGSQRLALLETAMGRYEDAHRRIRDTLPVARSSSHPMVRGHSPGRLLATAIRNRYEAGDLGAATEYLAQSFAEQAMTGECATCDVMLYPAAVPVYIALGDLQQAERASAKADETALMFRSRAWSASASSCRGLLAAARQEWQSACESLAAALQIFEALEQPYDVARTPETLADVAHGSGSTAAEAGVLRKRADDLHARLGSRRVIR